MASASAVHVVGVALGGVVGIFFLAQQRILGRARAEPPLALSKMETRTLRVPKSTPATMLIEKNSAMEFSAERRGDPERNTS